MYLHDVSTESYKTCKKWRLVKIRHVNWHVNWQGAILAKDVVDLFWTSSFPYWIVFFYDMSQKIQGAVSLL